MSEYIVDAKSICQAFPHGQFEEIVRCRDCKHYNEKTYEWVNGWTRTYTTCALFDGCRVEPNGFCAWGERRSND